GLELNLEHALFRAAVPHIYEVHWVARAVHAEKAHRDRDVVGSGLLVDDVEHLECDGLGAVDTRARRSTQPNLELTGLDARIDLGAEPPADEHDHARGDDDVGGDD